MLNAFLVFVNALRGGQEQIVISKPAFHHVPLMGNVWTASVSAIRAGMENFVDLVRQLRKGFEWLDGHRR